MSETIDASRWEAFCDTFAKEHHGFDCRIEVLGSMFGDQEMAAWLPFSGLSYDPHYAQCFITVGGISSHYPVHLTHRIDGPQRIAVQRNAAGEVESLLVASADNVETLLYLRRQPQLAAGPRAAMATAGVGAA